jgi:hypothetical protein
MENIDKIQKLLDIVEKKYLSKMFENPIAFEVGQIKLVKDKHFIIDILIPSYYLNTEPYQSKITEWWDKLLKVQEFYHHMNEEGSVNFQPIEKK